MSQAPRRTGPTCAGRAPLARRRSPLLRRSRQTRRSGRTPPGHVPGGPGTRALRQHRTPAQAQAGLGHTRAWDEQHARARRQFDAAWPLVEVEQGAARPMRPLGGDRGKIGDGNADGGRRGLGRLLEPIGLALPLERRVLPHQQPRQPRQHGRRHRGQHDDGQLQLALRVEPLPTRHVRSSVPRSCELRVVELSGGCQGCEVAAGGPEAPAVALLRLVSYTQTMASSSRSTAPAFPQSTVVGRPARDSSGPFGFLSVSRERGAACRLHSTRP